jgi:hypothetical protein
LAWITDWAPHQGSVDGKDRPVVQQGFDLSWKYIPLQSVKGCDMLPLVPGRSCERRRKGALKALQLCWLLGIVFINKSNLSRNFDKTLHWPMTLLGLWL